MSFSTSCISNKKILSELKYLVMCTGISLYTIKFVSDLQHVLFFPLDTECNEITEIYIHNTNPI